MVESTKEKSIIKIQAIDLKTNYTNLEKEKLLKKIKIGTKEWAGRNVNCIKGCRIGCIYCYAKAIAKHYRGYTDNSWRLMQINDHAVKKGYGKSKRKTSAPWDIMFPTTHNIFIEEYYFSACIKVLKKCLNAKNTVLITIKPNLAVVKKLCNIFEKFKATIGFRFTIGSVSSEILKIFEPFGCSFKERLDSLKYATNKGFSTTVSAEPLLDKDPYELIKKLEPYLSTLDYERDVGTIWIGLLKKQYIPLELRTGQIKQYLENLKSALQFDHVFSYYKELYSNERIKWKESILKLMIKNNIKVNLT